MVAGLEGEAELSALANSVGSIEIVGDAVYRDSSGLRAPSTLPVDVVRNKINPLESSTGHPGAKLPFAQLPLFANSPLHACVLKYVTVGL